ncbi:uncharacterized protein HMPREF1541_10061 [Cyphellophora europaea CBS 101466]|uniref:MAPEG family protein n=1 Tax=Cyphellophora europaea (strain CBS 101466) TaxID=1220924 RepID=W2SB85_CYPE1|nr:uncharacterized protein HMPREF1541_10061 [Cyphellophora europaea CBS 101466]ETN45184.1 hypothetical protein HMPREF1541_10061 [Cyphellophora europaea CBS 101466]
MANNHRLNDPRPFVQEKGGFATQQLSSLAHTPAGRPSGIMSSITSMLGLHAGAGCHAPYYLIGNFVFAHFILVPRSFKQYYGIDHNHAPRDDIAKYGDAAVQSGKITQRQLNLIKRSSAAHSNRVENYSIFAAAAVLAVAAGVPNDVINANCLLYSVASVAYGACYVLIETTPLSLLRTLSWYAGGWACVRLFWKAGEALNRR